MRYSTVFAPLGSCDFPGLLVVDPSVEQSATLLSGCDGRFEILRLSPDRDPISQIADRMQGRLLSSLHILSHGEPGALLLAGERIDRRALAGQAAALARIANSLTPKAEVVLYGCSVAFGREGMAFIESVADALKAPVAASASDVGAAARGGSWDLHRMDGSVAEPAFEAPARAAYGGLLAAFTNGADDQSGTAAADDLDGLDGDDTISGLAGNDTLSGGDGADLLDGGDGDDRMSGGPGDDTLSGGSGEDTMRGLTGADRVVGGAGADQIYGEDGADSLFGGADADYLSGGEGTDILSGGSGDDVLWGGAGIDTLFGGAGNDTLSGEAGADILSGGAGNDVFKGNAVDLDGSTLADFAVGDRIEVSGQDLSALNGTSASGSITLDTGRTLTLSGISAASGTFTAAYDGSKTTITLTAPSNGGGSGGGSDGGGSDGGGSGGGSGSGTTVTATPATPTGASGNVATTYTNTGSQAASTEVDAGRGTVTVTLTPGVTIDLEGAPDIVADWTGQDIADRFTEFLRTFDEYSDEDWYATLMDAYRATDAFPKGGDVPPPPVGALVTVVAPSGSTVVTYDPGPSNEFSFVNISLPGSIFSLPPAGVGPGDRSGASASFAPAQQNSSHDVSSITVDVGNTSVITVKGSGTISAGSADNLMVGDGADHILSLGAGRDTVQGGGGVDAVYGNQGTDIVYGNKGDDSLYGGQDADVLYGGQQNDIVYGNRGSDVLHGNLGSDTLYGGADADTVDGGAGDDRLFGNHGDDVLSGGEGDDLLSGGLGSDTLYGGAAGTTSRVDTLSGGHGDDLIDGGEGIDHIYTGTGADTVMIGDNHGYDVIVDFQGWAGDRILVKANANGTEIDTFAELQAHTTTVDGNAEINLGQDFYVRLIGVNAEQLEEAWFGFY